MKIIKEQSIRAANELLKEKDLLDDCRALARKCEGDPKRSHKDLVNELGFGDPPTIPMRGNKPQLDAYHGKEKVGIEREMREQMNVRSHLMFAEVGYQEGYLDVIVFILPTKNENDKATYERTLHELIDSELFTKYFQLDVPTYLIGVESE